MSPEGKSKSLKTEGPLGGHQVFATRRLERTRGRYTHSELRMNVGKHQNQTNKGIEADPGEAERQAESFLMPEAGEAVTGW